jgi:galactonate dehydratase
MKIARVEAFIVPPIWIFARIETEDGAFGWGEAGMNFRSPAVAAAIRDVESMLVGIDAERIEHVWQILRRSSFFRGGPVLSSALAAIDTALWDLRGRALGLPLSSLLGGRVRDRIRAYAWLSADDLCAPSEAEVLAEMTELRVRGHRTFKVTPPQAEPIVSSAYVSRVVERVEFILAQGDDVAVAMDVHGRWSMATAMRMMPALEPLGLLFVEEPLLAEHLDKLPQLVAASSVPIATGERLFSRWDFAPIVGAGLAVAQPDVALASGVSEIMRIASLAELHDVHVAPHCPFGPIALAASLHIDARIRNFLIQEQSLTHFNESFSQYVGNIQMFDVVDGSFRCPPGPGLGVEIDERQVRRQSKVGHDHKLPTWWLPDGTYAEF